MVLIEEGDEAGEVATTATVGCSARIVDFHPLKDGLLGISCLGERKFRVQRVWRAHDGLNMGEIDWLADEPAHADCPRNTRTLRETVQRALDDLPAQYTHVERKLDDAAWVGARLTELLPIALADKQVLLELDDPLARLATLVDVVPDRTLDCARGFLRCRTSDTARTRSRSSRRTPSTR